MSEFKPRWALALCLASLVLWLAFEGYTHNALEDALITYRYAENWSQGQGYAFTPNVWVQGTTTPLFTMLLALVGLILGPEQIWPASDVINLILGGGCAYLTAQLIWRLSGSVNAAYASIPLLLCAPTLLWSGTGGMETTLVLFWMALSAVLFMRKQFEWTAVVAALLVLTRIDGLIWAGLLFLAVLKENPKRAWLGAAAAAAIVLAWFAWAWSVFGMPLPHSVLAKSVIRPLKLQVPIWDLTHTLKWAKGALIQWSAVSAGVPIGLLAFGYGAYRLFKARTPFSFVLLAYVLVFPFLFYIRKAPYFAWYLVPLYWAGLVVGVYGLFTLYPRMQRPLLNIGLGGILLLCFGWRIYPKFQEFRMLQENEDSLRRGVGLWLEANTPPNARVAMEAIGYQGYFSNRAIVDIAGLISPEVLALVEEPYRGGVVMRRILHDLKPDYLVLRAVEVEENQHFHGGPLFPEAPDKVYFEQYYTLEESFEARHKSFWGKNAVLNIYKRQILQ